MAERLLGTADIPKGSAETDQSILGRVRNEMKTKSPHFACPFSYKNKLEKKSSHAKSGTMMYIMVLNNYQIAAHWYLVNYRNHNKN